MKKLKDLVKCDYDILVNGIKTDSREVKPNDLFVCIHGLYFDHHDFIDQAIEKGAVALIVDKQVNVNIPYVLVDNTNDALISICQKFYDNPTSNLKMIGVTGTDGKTTTATMIKQLINTFIKTAYIGTNGLEYSDHQIKIDNTTPVPEKLYEYLNKINLKKIKAVSLEVSSEALLHKRVDNILFDIAILTNITEDHLNIHKTVKDYVKAKAKLFSQVKSNGICILNKDDKHYEEIRKYCNGKIITYGEDETSDFIISNISFQNKTKFLLTHNQEKIWVESSYLGKYNVFNLTAAFITGLYFKIPKENLLENMKQMKPVKGRSEELFFGQDYKIILDYAHTENAIKNILEMLSQLPHKRIISITGSAGGREKEKRSKMGEAVLNLSDFVVFTMDDPRYEDVDEIIDDMLKTTKKNNYIRIKDRKEAIFYALNSSKQGDCVIILGKGRDSYMAIENKHIPYSDFEVVEEYFKYKKN